MNSETNVPASASSPASALSRRSFLPRSAAGAAVVSQVPFVRTSHAASDDPIRVAVIGCGGRGSGAAQNVVESSSNVKIVALADLFPEQVEGARKNFKDVPPDHCFSGFDAYKKALSVPDVNYVILATPPGFRPFHFRAAVEAGKHVFMEKPVATDCPGIRHVLETGEMAKQKNLFVAAGTQRRHQAAYLESIKRIQGGEIGDIVSLRVYWNGGGIWHRGDKGETEMERQIRNWYHYIWLSGDHIVEQHVHNLDVGLWVMKDRPVKCWGMGGRQCRKGSGQIYDHFSVEYEFANGVRMSSYCRQMPGEGNVSEAVEGTLGSARPGSWVKPRNGEGWRAPRNMGRDAYVQEHADLIESVRTGAPLNETRNVAESTLAAIMGREAAYSGQVITWEDAMKSTLRHVPEKIDWGAAPEAEVPMPGIYKFS